MVQPVSRADIQQQIESLIERRYPSSICPSEVARALCPGEADWRALMPAVRSIARDLATRGRLLITQRGKVLAADQPIMGAIRLLARPGEAVTPKDPVNRKDPVTRKDPVSGPAQSE